MSTTLDKQFVQITVQRQKADVRIMIVRSSLHDEERETVTIPIDDIDWVIGAMQRTREMEPKS
jgi:hypothetical protein